MKGAIKLAHSYWYLSSFSYKAFPRRNTIVTRTAKITPIQNKPIFKCSNFTRPRTKEAEPNTFEPNNCFIPPNPETNVSKNPKINQQAITTKTQYPILIVNNRINHVITFIIILLLLTYHFSMKSPKPIVTIETQISPCSGVRIVN